MIFWNPLTFSMIQQMFAIWTLVPLPFLYFFYFLIFFLKLYFIFNVTILYWFCHVSKWIRHRYTCVVYQCIPPQVYILNPPPSSLPYHPSGSSQCTSPKHPVSCIEPGLETRFILYMFQCPSSKSSHPLPLPPSPKKCSIHQCLFCCLVYRGIVTIFLNSIYMC